jgi:Zn-finger nucleic acid-binding protein
MRTYARGGLILELCEDCRGIFLDKGELERLIEVEGGGWSGIVSAAVDPRRVAP